MNCSWEALQARPADKQHPAEMSWAVDALTAPYDPEQHLAATLAGMNAIKSQQLAQVAQVQGVLGRKTIDESSFALCADLISAGIKSPYPLDIDDIHLPPSAIRGRVQQAGYFTGKVDAVTGKLRVDHSVDHAFWLEVDLMPLMQGYLANKFRPNGPEAVALLAKWQDEVAAPADDGREDATVPDSVSSQQAQ
jgi:hypothetical protein